MAVFPAMWSLGRNGAQIGFSFAALCEGVVVYGGVGLLSVQGDDSVWENIIAKSLACVSLSDDMAEEGAKGMGVQLDEKVSQSGVGDGFCGGEQPARGSGEIVVESLGIA